MNYKELDSTYISNTYKRQNVVIAQGKGSTAVDLDGKQYIDFTSGIGVNSLGFCNENWVNAITKQANTLQHTSNLYYTTPQIHLAEQLCKSTGYQKVFFGNSGAEANEGAIKIARKYSFEKYGENRNKILTLDNSFHGRTITTLKATGQPVFHNYFFPFTDGFDYADPDNLDATLKTLASGEFCAFMLEVVQGEGGVIALNPDYVKKVAQYCKENDILLIIDEVQTGIGRTGTLLAQEQYGVKGDITTLAKGLGGGLPIGAILLSETTENVFKFSDHGTTYGGNPIVCAGAITVLEQLDLDKVNQTATYFREKLAKMDGVESVSGLGMMIGISLSSKEAPAVIEACLAKGLIILSAKTKLRFLPPLNISKEEIDIGLKILEEVLSDTAENDN